MRQLQTPEIDADYVASLFELGHANGLDHIGVAPAQVMRRAREALLVRKRAGLSDSMAFTYRNPERSTEPQRSVAGAQAMVVAARSYVLDTPAVPEGPYASVARYAWVDHYAPLRLGLQAIVRKLRADGFRAVAFADDNSVVDREAAWLAGLGWFGKNANILVPGAGSFFVLGSVITTAPLPVAERRAADGCGSCRRCIDACPTQAIVAPGVVDAGRCLAWLLQRPGVFPREFRAALGTRIYGCDECQTVCPPTVRYERTATAHAADHVQAWVPLLGVLEASDDELLRDYGRWYLADRNPMWLRRNALVALGNFGGDSGASGKSGAFGSTETTGGSASSGTPLGESDPSRPLIERVLRRYVSHAEPVLRAHAVWAAARLGLHHLLPATDTDQIVIDELVAARQ